MVSLQIFLIVNIFRIITVSFCYLAGRDILVVMCVCLGFDEATLEPFFAQADENEDGQLDAVEFAGFRSVIRSRGESLRPLAFSVMQISLFSCKECAYTFA